MIQSRNRSDATATRASLFGIVALVSACASGPRPLALETTSALPDDPRRAPGVAVDPAHQLPPPVGRADSQTGSVVLRAPADPDAAREVVRSFFRAVSHASYSELEDVVSDDAWLSAGPMAGRQRARQYWQLRFSRLDYGSLAGSAVYREGELETYRAEDIPKLRPARPLAVVAQGDDVVVRVPISTPRSGKTRLFGDEIVFVLRPQGTRYAIVDMSEDFALP